MTFEKVLTKYQDIPEYTGTIDEYIAHGGYQALPKALRELQPADLIETVKRSERMLSVTSDTGFLSSDGARRGRHSEGARPGGLPLGGGGHRHPKRRRPKNLLLSSDRAKADSSLRSE